MIKYIQVTTSTYILIYQFSLSLLLYTISFRGQKLTRSQEYIGEEGKRSPTRLTGKKIRGYKKEKSTNQEDRRCGVVRAVSGCEEEGVIAKGSRKHQTIIMIIVMVY